MQVNSQRLPPYRWIAVAVLVVLAIVFALVYVQFRGGFTPKTELTMLASRAGLVMDPGSKVT
ncbi:CE-family protein, partial [Mycobacterium paraseoulense]